MIRPFGMTFRKTSGSTGLYKLLKRGMSIQGREGTKTVGLLFEFCRCYFCISMSLLWRSESRQVYQVIGASTCIDTPGVLGNTGTAS